jgi:hypothetical protein
MATVELNTGTPEEFSEKTAASAVAEYRSLVWQTARGKRPDELPPEDILMPADRLRRHWLADCATATRRLEFATDLAEAARLEAEAAKMVIPQRPKPGDTSALRGRVATDQARTRCPVLYEEIASLNRQISQVMSIANREAELCGEAVDESADLRRVLNDARTDSLEEHDAAGRLAKVQANFPRRRLASAERAVKAARKRAAKLEKQKAALTTRMSRPEAMRWA